MIHPKREVFYTMDSSRVEEIVSQEFGAAGLSWSFSATEEMSNDSHKVIYVSQNSSVDEDGLDYASASDIMSELANRGLIPYGKYLIEVCW